MGIDYSTYLGPYVRCKVSKVPSTKKVRTCSRDTCSQYEREFWDKTKFCVQCGSPIQDRDTPIEVDNVDRYEIRDMLDEALHTPSGDSIHEWMRDNNTHFWLSNRHIPGERHYSFDRDEMQMLPLTASAIAAETERFCGYFEKELVILRQEYGEQNVEIQWGLIHYIH